MLQSAAEAEAHMESGASLMGPGWREVASFEDLSDEDEYTTDEEEIYAVLDFGQAIDRQQLQTESTYQLVGIDTPVPFIKLGNQIYQGEMTSLIGDEVILGMQRDPANPGQPSHPPQYTSSHHLIFRPITLFPKDQLPPNGNGKALDPLDAPPKKLGRPKGSTTKPRVIVNSEAEVKDMDMGSLPDDVIIEVIQPQVEGADPVPNKRLTKHQAERIMAGLPASNRRLVDPITGLKVPRKRGRKKAEPVEVDLSDIPENAEAGPSNEPRRTGTGRESKKGKGKAKAAAGAGDHSVNIDNGAMELTPTEGLAGIPLGALYLNNREPAQVQPPKRPPGRPKKNAGVPAPAGGGADKGEGASASGTAAGTTAEGPRHQAGAAPGGGEGDVEMQEEDTGPVDAASPLMEVDDEGS